MIKVADLASATSATNTFDLLLSTLAPCNCTAVREKEIACIAIFNSNYITSTSSAVAISNPPWTIG